MKRSFSVLTAFVAMFVLSGLAFGQNDSTRTTTAITYPLDQTIEVPFHGTNPASAPQGSSRSESARDGAAHACNWLSTICRAAMNSAAFIRHSSCGPSLRTATLITWEKSNEAAADG
jgi:hypothetical protein